MTVERTPPSFQRDVERDLHAFRRRRAEVGLVLSDAGSAIPSPAREALLAVALHGAYGALESVFQRIAENVDRDMPAGSRWHADLLARMSEPVDGVRPAVISAASATWLRSLLGFRHFFRHSYGAEFDVEQLEEHGRRLLEHSAQTDLQILAFCGLEPTD